MNRLTWFAAGAVAGAAAVYFNDPKTGSRRRKELAQRGGALGRDAAETLSTTAERARNRAKGAVLEATRPLRDHGPVDDVALAERVRSEVLGSTEWRHETLNVDSYQGEVGLRGAVDGEERRGRLVRDVSRIPGVKAVHSYLHDHGTPAPNVAEVLTR